MSQLNKTQLENVNQTNFPNNNTGFITPTKLREFNTDMIDSLVDEGTYNSDSASIVNHLDSLQAEVDALVLSGSGVVIQEEGSVQGTATTLNFVGATVTASVAAGIATINVNASAVDLTALNAFTASAQAEIDALEAVTGSYVLTSSFNSFSSSVANEINSLQDVSGSFTTTASFNSYTASNNARVQSLEAKTGSYATTGSNTFIGNQTINGSINVTGDITASKLLVQIETASIIYSSGSNQLGDDLSDIQTLFGRVIVTGSLDVSQSISSSIQEGSVIVGGAGNRSVTVQTASLSVASASYAELAEDIFVNVKNQTGVQINKGTIVRIIGAVGDNPLIQTASWENDGSSANTLGWVAADIPNGGFGQVFTQGVLLGVNTDPMLGFAAGQVLYLSSSGQYTNVIPPAPYHEVRLGQVLRAQQNNGSVFVFIQNGYELGELHDVDITNPITGNLLSYNSASGQWTNTNQLTGSYGITGSLNITGSFILNGTNFSAATSGTSGIDGTNGSAGTSGINGTNGSAGTSGIDGTNGTAGSGGTSGVDGTNGTAGSGGTSGIDGTNGTGGTSGVNGTSGIDGTNGSGGTSGINGTNGSAGTSGINGTNGTAGTSGTSGLNGQASGRTYFFNGSVTGSVSGSVYRQLDTNPVITGSFIVSQSLSGSGGEQLIASYISEQLGVTLIPGGIQTFHLNFLKPSALDDIQAKASIQIADVFGTPSGSLVTSSLREIGFDTVSSPDSTILDVFFPTTTIVSSSKFIVKVFAKNNDASPKQIQFFTQGNNFSFLVSSIGLENGTSGTSGTSGTAGSGGTSGVDGTNGTAGSGGTSGIDGTNGSAGTSGIDGTNGTAGSGGTSGVSGTSGINGTNGSGGTSGVDGTSGINGTNGTGGTSGVDGTSGINGTNGTGGTSGIDGTSGVNGTSGVDGTSGVNGTNGSAGTSGTSISLTIADDGVIQGNAVTFLNFTGSGVSASYSNNTGSVFIAAGGASDFPFTGSAIISGSLQITGSISITGSNYLRSGSNSGSWVDNLTDSYTNVARAEHIVTLDSASYAALGTKDPNTLYIVSGSTVSNGTSGTSGVNGTNGTTAILGFASGSTHVAGNANYLLFSGSAVQALTISNNTASITLVGGTGTGAGFPFSGSAQITGSLGVTGSISVTGSYLITSQSFTGSLIDNVSPTTTNLAPVRHVIYITSASYAALATKDANTLYVISGSAITGSGGGGGTGAGFPFTGSAEITGSLIVTGSSRGLVVSASVASSTASLDFTAGNFFTCLITGSQFFNITNVRSGQVVNLLLTTVQNSPQPPTASFSSNVRQVSGSRYLPTSGSSGKEDILTFVTFSSSSVYLAKINDLR